MLGYVHDIRAQCYRSEGLQGHYHSFMKLLHDIDKKEEKKQDKVREMEEDMKMAEELGVPYEAILDEVYVFFISTVFSPLAMEPSTDASLS